MPLVLRLSEGLGDMPYLSQVALALRQQQYMLKHLWITGAEFLKALPCLSQRYSVIRARLVVQPVEILAIVLPKANLAYEVVAPFGQRHIVTARTLVP